MFVQLSGCKLILGQIIDQTELLISLVLGWGTNKESGCQPGLRTVIFTNPQQQQLRPYKVTVVERNGKTSYVYADPTHYQIYVVSTRQR
jgi:hypothetical protein